ncbi:MAG: phosphate ABC transporter substrate-binding protein [Anaerolineae bacterium]
MLTSLIGCAHSPRSEAAGIILAGSTSVQPFAELLAEDFAHRYPDSPIINVQGGGSTAGIEAALTHTADIGMSSRDLKEKERGAGLTSEPIAYDAIAIVVHLDNPVSALTSEQVRAIFSGRIGNWRQVGGEDRPIIIITREEGSGTRGAFEEMLMKGERISDLALRQDSNGAVRVIVSSDRAAIGYISLGIVGNVVKPVALDGVLPSVEAALAGQYPLVRPFLFVLNGQPSRPAQRFIDFVLSADAQAILAKEGLIPVKQS